jgi:hypothetical protein
VELSPLWKAPSLRANIRLEPTRVEPLERLHFNGSLLAKPKNIRLGWKLVAMANTLAYYDMITITTEKSFIIRAPALLRLEQSLVSE